MNNDDRIIQNADHIFVYDITDYADENFEYQYQYFIYNDEGTVLIDKGIQGVHGYIVVEKGISYLKFENMFNDKESYSYKLGKDDYIPGVISVKYKDGIIRVKNGQKEINIEVGNIF